LQVFFQGPSESFAGLKFLALFRPFDVILIPSLFVFSSLPSSPAPSSFRQPPLKKEGAHRAITFPFFPCATLYSCCPFRYSNVLFDHVGSSESPVTSPRSSLLFPIYLQLPLCLAPFHTFPHRLSWKRRRKLIFSFAPSDRESTFEFFVSSAFAAWFHPVRIDRSPPSHVRVVAFSDLSSSFGLRSPCPLKSYRNRLDPTAPTSAELLPMTRIIV